MEYSTNEVIIDLFIGFRLASLKSSIAMLIELLDIREKLRNVLFFDIGNKLNEISSGHTNSTFTISILKRAYFEICTQTTVFQSLWDSYNDVLDILVCLDYVNVTRFNHVEDIHDVFSHLFKISCA